MTVTNATTVSGAPACRPISPPDSPTRPTKPTLTFRRKADRSRSEAGPTTLLKPAADVFVDDIFEFRFEEVFGLFERFG